MNPFLQTARILTLSVFILLFEAGCSRMGFSGSSGSSIMRDSDGLTFTTKYPIRAYKNEDKNTADVYLTDLTDDELSAFFTESRDWSGISGTIAQIHLFLRPKPGHTPIEPTAASASIRWIIISNGEIGVFDGAGFMSPGGKITKGSLSASIKNAPLKLTRRTPGFSDPLVTPEIDLSFKAPFDRPSANELASRVQALAGRATPLND